MALKRSDLSALGIDAEKIETIIKLHSESISALKDEIDKYKKDAERTAAAEKELEELKKKYDPDLKTKYDNLDKEFNDYKTSVQSEKTLAAKKNAFKEIAKDAGLSEKGIEKAIKYTDWDSVEIDSKGKVKDAKKHMDSLKEEWSDYVVEEGQEGADTANPPANTGSKLTRDQILDIKDTGERQKAIAENHELFNI